MTEGKKKSIPVKNMCHSAKVSPKKAFDESPGVSSKREQEDNFRLHGNNMASIPMQ